MSNIQFWFRTKESVFELNNRLSSATKLGYFAKEVSTQVIASACPISLGAVLIQTKKNGPRVIAYAMSIITEEHPYILPGVKV